MIAALIAGRVQGQELPLAPVAGKPSALLQAEPEKGAVREGVLSLGGEVVAKEGADYVAAQEDRVTAAHKGLGAWGASFRYQLDGQLPAGEYTFWARWMQGGDPEACPQTFTVLAGPGADQLEQRGAFRLVNYQPWQFDWVHANKTLALKADDKVIEVRNSGKAQDGKVFDAFLLTPGNPPVVKAEKISGTVRSSGADEPRPPLEKLPTEGSSDHPQILLQLGAAAPSQGDKALVVYTGEVGDHEGDRGIEVKGDEVHSLRGGSGTWTINFRFQLPAGHPAGDYTFWARWKQGGDPKVSVQIFEVWAGSAPTKLEKRASMRLAPGGWNYVWRDGATVTIRPEDTVVEVRDSGNGQTAKIFSAFLLGGPKPPTPPVTLPVTGTQQTPVVLLNMGKLPLRQPGADPTIQVFTGRIVDYPGASSAAIVNDGALVRHNGFGSWGATMQFDLQQPILPGYYSFDARYLSGGEVSQVTQTFVVKAGPNEQNLGVRGTFQTLNKTPWQFQWIGNQGTVAIFPGDRVLQIVNSGRADGSKTFNAFALKMLTPMPAWLNAEGALLRNRFLALTGPVTNPQRHLYVVDGSGAAGAILFAGLAAPDNKTLYDTTEVRYLLGDDADAMARQLHLKQLPAAIMADVSYTIQGILAAPTSTSEVAAFLKDPAGHAPPPPPAVAAEAPQPLRNGVPEAWLVGGITDGKAGLSIYGLDSETVMRPNPGNPYIEARMMGGSMKIWHKAAAATDGSVIIEASTDHSYGWSRGTGYGQLYVHADRPEQVVLHVRQTGVHTAVWLDGRPLATWDDPAPPADFPKPGEQPQKLLEGLTTEGLAVTAMPEQVEPTQAVTLKLAPGWHSILVKMVMQLDKGKTFFFAAKFTDAQGAPAQNLTTQLSDPTADLGANATAARLRPVVFVDVPANLPRPGDPLKIQLDMRWHSILEERSLTSPLLPFDGRLKLRLVDFEGKELAVREVKGRFPGAVTVDFGPAPSPGYYALYPSLHTDDGKLIMAYWADGFTVVPGNVAQKDRLDKKKLWDNNYYAFNDHGRGFLRTDDYFNWLERSGIWKNVGSSPGGGGPEDMALWERSRGMGIVLFADTGGDSGWINDKQADLDKYVQAVAPYTRNFKCVNEIDIRQGQPAFDTLRQPEHWVERSKREYRTIHAARQDALYLGGSLVRPGDMRPAGRPGILGPGQWFLACLKLGLDKCVDAWDVHAYPQNPPRFGGPFGNSAAEDELGVLAAYQRLGETNKLPFFLGECGAKAAHCITGRRGQADLTAKMIAWVNSRSDYLGIAFCIGHEYCWASGRLWDYSMGHMPGEGAMITAGTLIDGLPYQAVDSGDPHIQAARFGDTFMIWRSDDKDSEWTMPLDGAKPWLIVDVAGHAEPLEVHNGQAKFTIGTSPLYVLSQSEYGRLTRN